MLRRPAMVRERLVPLLEETSLRNQTTVSLMVMAGQVMGHTTDPEAFQLTLRSLLPYIGTQNHSVRALAQYATHAALHRLVGWPEVEDAMLPLL